jgi:hypothetical protein
MGMVELHNDLAGRNGSGLCGDATIPARRVEYSLTESALFPFQAEPTHMSSLTHDRTSSVPGYGVGKDPPRGLRERVWVREFFPNFELLAAGLVGY